MTTVVADFWFSDSNVSSLVGDTISNENTVAEDLVANVSSSAAEVLANISSVAEAVVSNVSSLAEDVYANVSSSLGSSTENANYYENTYYNKSQETYGDASYGYEEAYGDPYGDSAYGDSAYGDSGYGGGYKKKEYGEDFYYGAMSVAVLTLGLVVIVEYILHNIDLSAVGKPFNQAVLDAVYRELAVLGIVELGIHIMQQYYEYDKDKKAVFADVHFLLFYTDIFNAFQAVIQAWATNLMTQRLWVRTEELELDHYVEIREEYDRIHKELYGVPPGDMSSSLKDEDVLRKRRSGWVNSVKNWITRPDLKIKYKELLLQVRFHELRVHFLQAYNLPLKLKVSDYLMRSENQIMIHLVHISPTAWLWLTAICNALYFCAGIIADQTGRSNDTATFYSVCFFVSMVVFVIASLLMDKHMELIFHRIMKSTRLWAYHEDDVETEEDEELADEQRSLFFLNNPDLVVTIIQFMQFGYAIALSVVFVYWPDMQKDEEFAAWPYLVSSVLCYILFVYNMSRVIPRYTLCSKLGQLVDKELLRETVATYKLKEEERQRAMGVSDNDYYYPRSSKKMDSEGTEDANSTESPTETIVMEKAIRSLSNDSDEVTNTDLSVSTTATLQRPSTASVSSGISARELVSMDTAALRQLQRKQSRRSSRRSMSEGVALMRQMSEEEEAEGEIKVSQSSEAFRPRSSKKITKSQSDGVNAMLMDEEPEPSEGSASVRSRDRTRESLLVDLVKMDTSSVRNALDESMNNSSGRRVARRKIRSAGVADMAAMTDIQEGVPVEPAPLLDTGTSLLDNSSQVGRVITSRRQSRKKTHSAGALIQQMRMAGTAAMENTKQVMVSAVPATTGFRLPFDSPLDDEASVGALSDVDDVDPAEHNPPVEESYKEPFSLNKWLCEFFTGPKYRLSCHIGGTMIIFFLVAMRVEGFLQKQCIVPEDDFSWDLPLEWTFLLEVLWLTVYLAGAVLVMLTFSMKEGELNRLEWTTVIAAIFNVALMGLCLALLLGAEAQRCCTDSESYYEEDAYGEESELASSYYGRFLADYGDEKDVCKDASLQCECADFGFRVHGGLGNMEPWTALIALQVFRFIIAAKICEWYNLGEEDHHHHDHGHHGHGHGHAIGPDAIADAWQAAVAKNPHLVEKYGEFSGEVLQAMLGLEVIERPQGNGGALPALTDGLSKEKSNQMVVSGQQGACVTLQDDQYKKLAPEVQEIIASGKCGMAVRCSVKTLAAAPMAPLEFEVDTRQMERLQMTTTLEFPNARIIRAVRRCDKMYLPLLDTWKTVDVILTNHEMLYVDVNDTDGSMEDQMKRIASTQALVATKGGKGLRLCDITAGRRVVGHLSLADITAVHVDREMRKPKDGKPEPKEVDVDVEASKKLVQAHEVWQTGGDEHFDGSLFAERWEDVPQDKLHIDTNHGTLYLRFYSDLKEYEEHKELHANEPSDTVHKDIAFQWAQTLVHLVHKQLKQSLPHFGEKGEEELRDYLHMTSC